MTDIGDSIRRMDKELQRLVDDQYGLCRYGQIRQHGYSRKRVQHLIESGHWLQVLHGVYSVTNGPLTRDMVVTAALLYGGGYAILSHRTAAEELGILAPEPDVPVHITVPFGRSAVHQPPTVRRSLDRLAPSDVQVIHPGVFVHRSRAIVHICVPAARPRTTLADTAIDLATAEPTPQDAFRTFVSIVTDGRIRLADIRHRVEHRRPRRYAGGIADAIRLLSDGVQSILELRYATDVEQAHGLPMARRQSPVVVDGRTLYEDVDYSDCGVALIVRLDGKHAHSMAGIAFRDRRRENAAEVAGKRSLVYGWEEVQSSPCAVAAEVRYVLERDGWSGENPCPRCV